MTTRDEIRDWFQRGVKLGATHMIVACDTFDHSDYPVYVARGEDVRAKAANPGSMQRVMEVYALHLDMDAQLGEHRAFHYDAPPERARCECEYSNDGGTCQMHDAPELPSDPFAVPEDK